MYTKFCRIIFIIIIVFSIVMSIASISAYDNSTIVLNTDNNDWGLMDSGGNDTILVNDDEYECRIGESCNGDSNSSDANKLEDDGRSVINESSYLIEYDTLKKSYSMDQTDFNVKVFTNTYYNGILYKEPLSGFYIKINVYSGNKVNTYAMTTNSNGVASFKISSLDVGVHKVEIYDKSSLKATSSINIVKTKFTVLTQSGVVSYKKSECLEIRIVDNYNYPIKNFRFKIKVYTGKKYKLYTRQTDSKGIAKFNTRKLSLGVHKIVVTVNNKNYCFDKSVKIHVVKHAPSTKVRANAVTVKYKKESYFNVKVLSNLNKAVSNIKLKVITKSHNNHKTYNIKTGEDGIAKLNTKTLSVGTHRITIKSNAAKHKFVKQSKIIVKKSKSEAPILKDLKYYQKNGAYYAEISWHSEKNVKYQILKKQNNKFSVVGTKVANSNKCSFREKVDGIKNALYTVREVHGKSYGPYDKNGIGLMGGTQVCVHFKNTKATIKWAKVEGATKYSIYRKVGSGGFKSIAIVDSNTLGYNDYYYKYPSELSVLLQDKYYVDPMKNTITYNVRALKYTYNHDNKKISYGMMSEDGECNLVPPTIISFKKNVIKWATVPNAKGYLILEKNSSDWKIIGQCESKSASSQSFKLNTSNSNSYYSVQAYSVKNNKQVFSDYDKGFTLKYRSENITNQRILFIGDSILYGGGNKFSIPNRVEQMLGCDYYNPSCPGGTYAQNNYESRCSISTEIVYKLYNGEIPYGAEKYNYITNSIGESNTKLEDYNIIVLGAGTNDYAYNIQLGSDDSKDIHTFNGAIFHILEKIEKASKNRVLKGEEPIKVVFMDLFYSCRLHPGTNIENRDTTLNNLGLTLTAYQNALNKQYTKWSSNSCYLSFYKFSTRSYNIINGNNCEYNTIDNLHPTMYSNGQYGNELVKFLYNTVI